MLQQLWLTIGELAPWLLLGMILAGLMHVILPPHWIRRHFQGMRGVVQAVLFGIPLPLCSCGVIPAGIGLKKEGASDGAAMGFLIATPQTGVDSILVSAAFLGWPFAFFKMFSALVTGIVGGWLTEKFSAPRPIASPGPGLNLPVVAGGLPIVQTSKTIRPRPRRWSDAVTHALEILRSIWGWLVIRILVSAFLNWSGPSELVGPIRQWGTWTNMAIVLVISLPLYVCATASVPIAAALIQIGFSPAAAFVFLMAGPSTNVTTLGAIYSKFGVRHLVIYLVTIVGGSFGFGLLFEYWFGDSLLAIVAKSHAHHHDHLLAMNWLSTASSVILLGLIAWFAWERIKRWWTPQAKSTNAAGPVITLAVSGMHCQSCVDKLETALRKDPQVQSVKVELEPGQVTVTGTIKKERIAEIIHSVGFVAD